MNAAPAIFELRGKRIFVAGHKGMVGLAIMRRLKSEACEVVVADRSECDLRRPDQVERYLARTGPDAIFLAAGTVGGIHANDPAKISRSQNSRSVWAVQSATSDSVSLNA